MDTHSRYKFKELGYYLEKNLFHKGETKEIKEHFMKCRVEGPKPGDVGGDEHKGSNDPLNKYPRFINMHKWDKIAANLINDKRLFENAKLLINDEIILYQTMLYFKPPGARGQGLHQDHQYIREYPLIGVWLALDDSDKENGQMMVIPKSNKLGLQEVEETDMTKSFTTGQSVIPKNSNIIGIDMKCGDVLFFDGFLIHGSYLNTSKTRFRRAFITHYYSKNYGVIPMDLSKSMKKFNYN